MKDIQVADPVTTKTSSNIALTLKRWGDSVRQSTTNISVKKNASIYIYFTGKGKRIMFEGIEDEDGDTEALHGDDRKGKDKEDEFKEVFCDKKRFIYF